MNENDKNEILRKALEECLNEEIRTIPPKDKLEKQYTFSDSFEENIEQMMKKRKKKRSISIFIKIAACLILLFVVRTASNSFYTEGTTEVKHSNLEKEAETQKNQKLNENRTQIAENNKIEQKTLDSIKQQEEDKKSNLQDEEEKVITKEDNKEVKDDSEELKSQEKDEKKEETKEHSEEDINLTKASTKSGEEKEIVSQLLSAVMEEGVVKVTIYVENKTENTIICSNDNSLEVLEEGQWMQLNNFDGTISSEEKEIDPGEIYDDTIVITGYDLEIDKQYKIIKLVGGEEREIVFEL